MRAGCTDLEYPSNPGCIPTDPNQTPAPNCNMNDMEAQCNSATGCSWSLGGVTGPWHSRNGMSNTCAVMAQNNYCTSDYFNTFGGVQVTSADACCGCGGGMRAGFLSSSSVQWKMSNQVSNRQGASSFIASDKLGRIYVAYEDNYNDDTANPPALQKITVKRLSSFSFAPETTGVATSATTGDAGGVAVQTWRTLGTEGKQGQHASQNKADNPTIVFDSLHRPLVLYRDVCNLAFTGDTTAEHQCPDGVVAYSLSMSRFDAQSNKWTQVGPRGFSESGGYSAYVRDDGFSVAVAADDKVYVAYLVRKPDGVENDIGSWLKVAIWDPNERIAPSSWSRDDTWQSETTFAPHKVGLTAHDNVMPLCSRHSSCSENMYDHKWSNDGGGSNGPTSWRSGCLQSTGSARPSCERSCHYCCKDWGSLRCRQDVLPDDMRRKWRHLPSPVDNPQWNMLTPGATVVAGRPSLSTYENIPVLCYIENLSIKLDRGTGRKYDGQYHCKKLVQGKWQSITGAGDYTKDVPFGRGGYGQYSMMYRAFDTVMHPTGTCTISNSGLC